jgi:hypothetical protein
MVVYGAKRLYIGYNLSKSEKTEKATIRYIYSRIKAFEDAVYFSLDNDTKQYRINLSKIFAADLKVNDKVDVVFNDKRDFYIIKQYEKAFFDINIIIVVLSLSCIYFSHLSFKATIEIYNIDA